ncbi:aspartyl protease family protein [Echinicola sediminis]
MKKGFALTLILLSLVTLAFGNEKSEKTIDQQIYHLQQAIQMRDYALMKEIIADDFSIGVYHYQMKERLLKSIVANYPAIQEIHREGEPSKDRNGNTLVPVIFRLENGKEIASQIGFDANQKIKYVGVFDLIYGVNRVSDKGLIASLPFEIVEGKIHIEIRLNDSSVPLTMLFDTGADGIGLSPQAAKKVGIGNFEEKRTSVVGGSTNVKLSRGNTLHIAENITLKNQSVVVFPGQERKEDGLIGGNILRNFTTSVDFDQKVIELYDFNSYNASPNSTALPFNYGTGLPVIDAMLTFGAKEKKEVKADLIFDTGAGYNMILFGPFVGANQLTEGFDAVAHSNNISMGLVTPTLLGELTRLQLGDRELENFIVSLQQEVEGRDDRIKNAGSLGINIISRFNFTIDALHKRIYLEPNQSFTNPFEFVLGGMFLNYDLSGELIVKQVVKGSQPDIEGIKAGDKVLMIEGYSPEDIKKEGVRYQLLNSEKDELIFRIASETQTMQLNLPKKL